MPLVTVPSVLSSLLAAVHTGLAPELLRRISPLLAGTRYTMEGGEGGGEEREGGEGEGSSGERGEQWSGSLQYIISSVCQGPAVIHHHLAITYSRV